MKKIFFLLIATSLFFCCDNDVPDGPNPDAFLPEYEKHEPELNTTEGIISKDGGRIEIVSGSKVSLIPELPHEYDNIEKETYVISDKIWHYVWRCDWFTITSIYDINAMTTYRLIIDVEPNTTGKERTVPLTIETYWKYGYIGTNFVQEK